MSFSWMSQFGTMIPRLILIIDGVQLMLIIDIVQLDVTIWYCDPTVDVDY